MEFLSNNIELIGGVLAYFLTMFLVPKKIAKYIDFVTKAVEVLSKILTAIRDSKAGLSIDKDNS